MGGSSGMRGDMWVQGERLGDRETGTRRGRGTGGQVRGRGGGQGDRYGGEVGGQGER